MRQVGLRDAAAGVAHGQYAGSVVIETHRDVDLAVRRRVPDGVGDEVRERSVDLTRVDVKHHPGQRRPLEAHTTRVRDRQARGERVGHEVVG